MAAKLFNVYVLTLKKTKGNKSVPNKYIVKNWRCFWHVSRERACYYIMHYGCGSIIGMTKDKVVSPEVGTQIFGFDAYNPNMFTFCEADPVCDRHFGFDDTIFPDHSSVGITLHPNFHNKIQRLIDTMSKREYLGCGLVYLHKCRDIFVPEQFIPKGWEHITSGKIQKGDLVWEHNREVYGYWREPFTFEDEHAIEATGIEFRCENDESKSDSYSYYSPFVIRKKA